MFTITKNNEIAHVTMNAAGPVNSWGLNAVIELRNMLDNVLADAEIKGVILSSAKKDWFVGADLKEIMATDDITGVMQMGRMLTDQFRRMETSGKMFVAAINGSALGGGYELALACHKRIALNNPQTRIGFPEVTIGLLPGAGGTQRFPRLVGIQASLPLMLEGKRLAVDKALGAKMIDAIAQTPEEMMDMATKAIREQFNAVQPWDVKGYKMPGGGIEHPDNVMFMAGVSGNVIKRTFGNYPAPIYIIRAVNEGLQLPFERALNKEQEYFETLLRSKESKNLIRTLFLHMGEAAKIPASLKEVETLPVQKIGILGAGMMGAGIAYVSILAGYDVVLKDRDKESAEKGKDYSRKLLDESISKGKSTREKADALLEKIKTTGNADDLSGCDLIIEAVFEDRALKAAVTKESEAVMNPKGVFASNTSTLPITGLAEASARPDNFIGLHFFSPVDKMQLVEIIRGKNTSDFAVKLCLEYVQKIKKTPIVVNDGRGFFTSRIFTTYLFEAFEMVAEGVSPALIENCGKMTGMATSPLAVADEVSLELIYKIMLQTEKDLGTAYNTPGAALIKKMVGELKRLGRKSGGGFYEYPEGGKKKLWKGLSELVKPAAEQPDAETVKQRLLYIQALEAAKCWEEGIVQKPADADLGSIFGWGFAPHTGGVLSYIDHVGLPAFLARAEEFATKYGERFTPCKKLREIKRVY
ncbi:MAG: 3-hydroxyacyl-CoA dehydrogenase NAD-binding domain-containing protein [Flavobacteriales bacterium]|nr:3-hydroxyacyl-CoA dehydrogenase NAD-binding domain-containing protein [Flavobacteriales bacterium]